MRPFLSVIIPVYNVEDYLYRCIDSISKQTLIDLEIILINDGSTDTSGIICNDFADKDNRIKVIHQKNAGVSVARNKGVEIAIGDYVTFVDSDDWIEPTMYEEMFKTTLQNNSLDVVMCDFVNVRKNTKEKTSSLYWQ